MRGFHPKMISLLWQGRRRPEPDHAKAARELDPRPPGCDCGRSADSFVPDTNGHSWRCPCGLSY